MQLREFFLAVIPWEGSGFCNVHQLVPGKGMPGTSHPDIDSFLEGVKAADPGLNTFFCLSRQRVGGGHRERDCALAFSSLFGDLDVGPGDPDKYPDVASAIAAVFRFCKAVSLPLPSAMVVTGGGIHVYWFANRVLTLAEWQPFADGLKQLFKNNGLKADLGVTADAARVLRVPGTKNYKYDPPERVFILPQFSPGSQYDFDSELASLLNVKPVGSMGPIADGFADLDPNEDIGIKREPPPIDFEKVKAGCGWLRNVHASGGLGEPEPRWWLALKCCIYLTEGDTLIHELSNGDPRYNRDDTEAKFARASQDKVAKDLGYPRCQTIHGEGAKQCNSCEHLIKNKSPLNLGQPTREARQQTTIEQLNGERPEELHLPDGFFIDETTGHLMGLMMTKKGIELPITVIPTRIANPQLIWQNGAYGLGFEAHTEMNTKDAKIFVSNADIYGDKAPGKLAAQLVMTPTSRLGKEMVKTFTASWVDKLRAFTDVAKDSGTLGWRYDKNGKRTGFIYGEQFYHTDGVITPMRTHSDDEFNRWYKPTGAREPWLDAMRLITDRKRPELDVLVSIGFAAPLVAFTGNIYGGIINCWGEPGTFKSSAQQVAASVYGHPKQTRESLTSTPKSVQNRLGRIRNLAAYWDDIQSLTNQEHLGTTMFVATEGAEGGRLNPDATYKERKEWQTMLVACSNVSFVEYLLHVQKRTTAGIRRVLEFRFDKGNGTTGILDDRLAANRILSALEHNYGVIGQEYIKLIVEHHNEIERLVSTVIQRFIRNVQGKPDENYWWSMCGVLIVGAALARQLGARMDVIEMENFLVGAFLENRNVRAKDGAEATSESSVEEILVEFLNFYRGTEQVLYTDVAYKDRWRKVLTKNNPASGKPLIFQVVVDELRVIIRKAALKDWLNEKNHNVRGVTEGIIKFQNAVETKFTIAGGTSMSMISELCYDIPVPPGSRLYEMLVANGPPGGQIKAVS